MVTINSDFDSGKWDSNSFYPDFQFTDFETDSDPNSFNLNNEKIEIDSFETANLRLNLGHKQKIDWNEFTNSEKATGKETDNQIPTKDKEKTESEKTAQTEAERLIALNPNTTESIAEAKKILLAEGAKKKIWDLYNSFDHNIPAEFAKQRQLSKLFGHAIGDIALHDNSNLEKAISIFTADDSPESIQYATGSIHGNARVYIRKNLEPNQQNPTDSFSSPVHSLLF